VEVEMLKSKRRGERRFRAQQLAEKRWRLWVDVALYGVDDTSFWPVGSFRKSRPWNCNCAKAHKGAPRRDRGMCDMGRRREIYRSRARIRELNHLVILRGVDPDEDEAALLTG
jgi:hypothetical protein